MYDEWRISMRAFDNYLRISSFLGGYLCKEMLIAVAHIPPSPGAPGHSNTPGSKYAFYKDAIYQRSSGAASEMLCRALNIRELAFISEKVEEYLIENGY
jgi:hypothetical protein